MSVPIARKVILSIHPIYWHRIAIDGHVAYGEVSRDGETWFLHAEAKPGDKEFIHKELLSAGAEKIKAAWHRGDGDGAGGIVLRES